MPVFVITIEVCFRINLNVDTCSYSSKSNKHVHFHNKFDFTTGQFYQTLWHFPQQITIKMCFKLTCTHKRYLELPGICTQYYIPIQKLAGGSW